jgi:endonuclease I
MKKILIVSFWLVTAGWLGAQIPQGYYDDAGGLHGVALQEALHNIIKSHDAATYGEIWDYLIQTDKKPNGRVWDIYSDVPGGTPPYEFVFFSDQCGNYGQEGDCYNREHSFPSSWFGGNNLPMYTDMHHVFPTDGYVNNRRNNYPYGEVSSSSWISLNGSKLGQSSTAGYGGVVFEPIDAYKGDLARMHFYMATRYLGQDGSWPGSPSVNGAQMKEWTLTMLYAWHQNDPVSQKEIDRNNAIYQIQQNRNPFVDHPEFADLIWFYTTITDEPMTETAYFTIFPNPANDVVHIKATGNISGEIHSVVLTDVTGKQVSKVYPLVQKSLEFDISALVSGFYFMKIYSSGNTPVQTHKLIIN